MAQNAHKEKMGLLRLVSVTSLYDLISVRRHHQGQAQAPLYNCFQSLHPRPMQYCDEGGKHDLTV